MGSARFCGYAANWRVTSFYIMKTKLLDFSVLKEEISQNNVLKMAELIDFMELRFQICYSGNRAQKMYADLFADIKQNTN